LDPQDGHFLLCYVTYFDDNKPAVRSTYVAVLHILH